MNSPNFSHACHFHRLEVSRTRRKENDERAALFRIKMHFNFQVSTQQRILERTRGVAKRRGEEWKCQFPNRSLTQSTIGRGQLQRGFINPLLGDPISNSNCQPNSRLILRRTLLLLPLYSTAWPRSSFVLFHFSWIPSLAGNFFSEPSHSHLLLIDVIHPVAKITSP